MKRKTTLFICLFFISFSLFNAYSLNLISTENANLGGLASIRINCDPSSAQIYIDNSFAGYAPKTISGITPGTHSLKITYSGYKNYYTSISIAPDTITTISVELEKITGFLNVSVNPQNAVIIVDGQNHNQGLFKVQTGMQKVSVLLFGYEEYKTTVKITENDITNLNVELQKADFQTTFRQISKASFNPKNSGMKSLATISYRVTSPGYAIHYVLDEKGQIVYNSKTSTFDTWEQAFDWGGKSNENQILKDGKYTLGIDSIAIGEEGLTDDKTENQNEVSFSFKQDVIIDSSIIYMPAGFSGTINGYTLCPTAFLPADDGFRVGLYAALFSEMQEPDFGLALNYFAKDKLDIGFGIFSKTHSNKDITLDLDARLSVFKTNYIAMSAILSSSFMWDSSYSGTIVKLSPQFGFGKQNINLSLSPYFSADFSDSISLSTGSTMAITLANNIVSGSLSTSISSSNLLVGTNLAYPISLALDVEVIIPSTAISFGAILQLDFYQNKIGLCPGLLMSTIF